MGVDVFALYATKAENSFKDTLVTPEPIPHEHISCVLKEGIKEPCVEVRKPRTREELYEALSVIRKEYEPYLADYAPKVTSTRQIFFH